MSTKIYNAYRLDNCTFEKLNKEINKLRPKIFKEIKQNLFMYNSKIIIYFYLFSKVLEYLDSNNRNNGNDENNLKSLNRINECMEMSTNKQLLDIYKCIKEDNCKFLLFYCRQYLINCCDKYEQNNSLENIANYFDFFYPFFRSKLVVFSYESGFLMMHFGDSNLEKIIKRELKLKDYHYQNQSDKPRNVNKKDWAKREQDWDTVIGNDYVPILHGPVFHLGCGEESISTSYIFSKSNIKIKHIKINNEFIQDVLLELSYNTNIPQKKILDILKNDELLKMIENGINNIQLQDYVYNYLEKKEEEGKGKYEK